MDEDAIRIVVKRLSRPHPSGGKVIERSAILAEGGDCAAILEWITTHDGQPEDLAPAAGRQGLHGVRVSGGGATDTATPRRYVLPAGVLS